MMVKGVTKSANRWSDVFSETIAFYITFERWFTLN
jgi:hypothetical protein